MIYTAGAHRLFANVQFAHPTFYSRQDINHDYTSNSVPPFTFAVPRVALFTTRRRSAHAQSLHCLDWDIQDAASFGSVLYEREQAGGWKRVASNRLFFSRRATKEPT